MCPITDHRVCSQVLALLGPLSAADRQGRMLEALCLAASLRQGDVGGARALAADAGYDTAVIRVKAAETDVP